MDLIEIAQRRYATKKFNPKKSISAADFAQIQALLRLCPSSVNSQPWHFVVAKTEAGRFRIAKSAVGCYSANHSKIIDASHVIVFCAKQEISDEYLQQLLEQEAQDGRFPTAEVKETVAKVRAFYADLHRKQRGDVTQWLHHQVYLNIGYTLMAAAALGVDAVPIEGVDLDLLNQEFELPQQGYQAVAVIALGYQAEDDFNAQLPKSRLPETELFTEV